VTGHRHRQHFGGVVGIMVPKLGVDLQCEFTVEVTTGGHENLELIYLSYEVRLAFDLLSLGEKERQSASEKILRVVGGKGCKIFSLDPRNNAAARHSSLPILLFFTRKILFVSLLLF
jgi:hypothetical protein